MAMLLLLAHPMVDRSSQEGPFLDSLMCRRKETGAGACRGFRRFTRFLAGVVESAGSRRKEEAALVIAETGADF